MDEFRARTLKIYFVDPRCDQENSINITGKTVLVIVGEEAEEYHVHEIILKRSPFFAAALNKAWKEGQEGRVTLQDDDPVIVYRYIQWLYDQRIASKLPHEYHNYKLLASLYVLGEKLLDRTFQDAVLDAMIAASRRRLTDDAKLFPGADHINIIFDGTPPDSPARRFLIDCYAHGGLPQWMESGTHDPTFMTELIKAMMANRGNPKRHSDLDEGKPCAYHHHGKDESCGRSLF